MFALENRGDTLILMSHHFDKTTAILILWYTYKYLAALTLNVNIIPNVFQRSRDFQAIRSVGESSLKSSTE